MPIKIGHLDGIPENYWEIANEFYSAIDPKLNGEVGYLTIDEKELNKGETLRRPGRHVDGYFKGWNGGWGGGWGSCGMLVSSNTNHCKAYWGSVEGEPDEHGGCEHLEKPNNSERLEANKIYHLTGSCIHESLPVEEKTVRQWVRMSMPSDGPWFEGYTENPCGIKPTGEILPRRDKFMAA